MKQIGGVLLAVLCFVGCDAGNGVVSGSTWSTDCGPTGTSRREVKFTESTMTFTIYSYESASGDPHPGCVLFDYQISYIYDSSVGPSLLSQSMKDDVDEFWELDLTLQRVEFTPLTGALTADANDAVYCGKDDWVEDEAVDLLALGSADLLNCGDFAGFGAFYAVEGGIAEAKPFSVVRLNDLATVQRPIIPDLGIFASFGVVAFNQDEKALLLPGVVSLAGTDGTSGESRLINLGAGGAYLKVNE